MTLQLRSGARRVLKLPDRGVTHDVPDVAFAYQMATWPLSLDKVIGLLAEAWQYRRALDVFEARGHVLKH